MVSMREAARQREILDHVERPPTHYPGVSILVEGDAYHHIPREPYALHHAVLVGFYTRTLHTP